MYSVTQLSIDHLIGVFWTDDDGFLGEVDVFEIVVMEDDESVYY